MFTCEWCCSMNSILMVILLSLSLGQRSKRDHHCKLPRRASILHMSNLMPFHTFGREHTYSPQETWGLTQTKDIKLLLSSSSITRPNLFVRPHTTALWGGQFQPLKCRFLKFPHLHRLLTFWTPWDTHHEKAVPFASYQTEIASPTMRIWCTMEYMNFAPCASPQIVSCNLCGL